ncbi:YoaK family protein [Acinetobacter rudis]|uniref:YoaK family protein n=1 Tax=Acinetobacter rudis TaxID=632955 RepID=A0AAW8J525_9GAMM|nr:YoaK family protein [Acinetobacter rudis]MDQ8934477.1 YoaK family protein [Acinetobacter rudis]MDQ9016623.1 YoaK family protein [Acinetobacter rudis]
MENVEIAKTKKWWSVCRDPVLLTIVGGAIDTIGFIALFGFFTAHVTGNLVLAGAAWVKDGGGIWIKLSAIPLFILTVALTKYWIDQSTQKHTILSYLFLAEAVFLLGFMFAGICFEPFKDANSVAVAITGGLGLIALAIRNTSSKTLIKHISPSTMMTGNTTQLGIDISNYLRNKTDENKQKLQHSLSIVIGFVVGAFLGAFLYINLGFWSVAFFIIPVLYLSYLAKKQQFIAES